MADSSVNSNGNVLPYYEEWKSSLHLSGKFTIVSATGSVHYDKEMVKRTMLVHEATFQKQVFELHRLYKIQKDLMAQFQGQGKELNGYSSYADTLQSRSYASQPGDLKGVWQTGTPISDHDLKQSSTDLMNETSSQYSVNGASLRCSNVRPRKKMLDLQLPADVYADDDDDDVKILEEKSSKHLPGTNGSVHGGNVNINLGNSDSKHVEKSWTTDIQLPHNSAVHIFNKPVEESSNMKITDFLGVGISNSHKQHHLSQGVHLNHLALQRNSGEKCAGNMSASSFFCANKEMRHINSFRQIKNDPNVSMELLQQKRNDINSSVGHYISSDSSFNHLIAAPPLFNDALNSPWQSNNMSYPYLTKSHNGTPLGSTSNTPHNHPPKISGELQYWKPPPRQNYLKDLDLNEEPADTTATWQQGSENSMVNTSVFRDEAVNLMMSQVPSHCANGLSQTFVSSTLFSKDRTLTGIPSFPISAAAGKDSQCSPALECDNSISTSIMHEADKETPPKSKDADSSVRDLFDLNEALPVMDDPGMDVCEPEVDIAPHEADDPSKDSLSVTAAENLVALCNDGIQPGSPQLDTLHWLADLATLKENIMCGNDSDDDFEALTLKLEETKSYECHSTPRTQGGDSNVRHCSAASLLVTRPRRGKACGRPPKKDFQKDILPNLASLPKQDVSEDLHLLGKSKPVTLAKRGSRNGQQKRGRRRSRSMAAVVVVEEAEVSPPSVPPPPPLVSADLDAHVLHITRWGRTTRRCGRCRRPRCPPVNNASLHVT